MILFSYMYFFSLMFWFRLTIIYLLLLTFYYLFLLSFKRKMKNINSLWWFMRVMKEATIAELFFLPCRQYPSGRMNHQTKHLIKSIRKTGKLFTVRKYTKITKCNLSVFIINASYIIMLFQMITKMLIKNPNVNSLWFVITSELTTWYDYMTECFFT